MALYSFLGVRGIGTNGVRLTISKWIGFFFLSLLEKIIRFYSYINVLRVKNENQNLSTDFLVALSAETPWMVNPFPLKKRKFTM